MATLEGTAPGGKCSTVHGGDLRLHAAKHFEKHFVRLGNGAEGAVHDGPWDANLREMVLSKVRV